MAALLARLAAVDWVEFVVDCLYWAFRAFWYLALAGTLLVIGFFYGIHYAIDHGGTDECFKRPPIEMPKPGGMPQPYHETPLQPR